jgi:FAD/FMN-containing dehydrogenase
MSLTATNTAADTAAAVTLLYRLFADKLEKSYYTNAEVQSVAGTADGSSGYSSATLSKLRDIKQRFDPTNMFSKCKAFV